MLLIWHAVLRKRTLNEEEQGKVTKEKTSSARNKRQLHGKSRPYQKSAHQNRTWTQRFLSSSITYYIYVNPLRINYYGLVDGLTFKVIFFFPLLFYVNNRCTCSFFNSQMQLHDGLWYFIFANDFVTSSYYR